MIELIDSLSLNQLLKIIKLAVFMQLKAFKKCNTMEDIVSLKCMLDTHQSYVIMDIQFSYTGKAIWSVASQARTSLIAACINPIFDCEIVTTLSGYHNILDHSARMVFHPKNGLGDNRLHKSKESIIFGERNPKQEEVTK